MKALGSLLCALVIFCCGCGKEEAVTTTLPTTTNIIITSEVETEVNTEAPTTVYIPPTTEAKTEASTTVYIPPTTEAKTEAPTTVYIPPTTEAKTEAPTTIYILPTTEAKTEAPTTVYIPPTTEAPTTVYIPPTTEAPTTVYIPPTTEAPKTSSGMRYFSVNNVTPPFEFQEYLYKKLCEFGIEWFHPTAVCQIYQESNWNQWSDNGRDRGLCQFKEIYWADRARAAGWAGADIWDPYAQLHVYAFTMSEYLRAAEYNVGLGLSMYFTGRNEWSDIYVGHVTKWLDHLKEVWR